MVSSVHYALKRIFSTDRFPSIHCSYNLGQFKRSLTKEIQIISEFKRLTKENASTNCQNNSHQIRLPVWFLIWLQSRSSTKRRLLLRSSFLTFNLGTFKTCLNDLNDLKKNDQQNVQADVKSS